MMKDEIKVLAWDIISQVQPIFHTISGAFMETDLTLQLRLIAGAVCLAPPKTLLGSSSSSAPALLGPTLRMTGFSPRRRSEKSTLSPRF